MYDFHSLFFFPSFSVFFFALFLSRTYFPLTRGLSNDIVIMGQVIYTSSTHGFLSFLFIYFLGYLTWVPYIQ